MCHYSKMETKKKSDLKYVQLSEGRWQVYTTLFNSDVNCIRIFPEAGI